MTCASCWPRIVRNSKRPRMAETSSAPQVTICAPRSPRALPKKPAIAAASSGRKTITTATASALHHIDVFDLDRPAVAEIDDEDRQPDRRLGRRHGQHEHREDLAGKVLQSHGKGDEVNVDREQHQLDRHQDDDDVLAVQEDAENPEREEDRRDGQVMAEPDHQSASTLPPRGTLTTSTDCARVRPSWAAIDWRRDPTRWRRVSTMAPIIATSRITP